jgi:hypothetical protein
MFSFISIHDATPPATMLVSGLGVEICFGCFGRAGQSTARRSCEREPRRARTPTSDVGGSPEANREAVTQRETAHRKRRRAAGVHDAGANYCGSRVARSVLECASPLALLDFESDSPDQYSSDFFGLVVCRVEVKGMSVRTMKGMVDLSLARVPESSEQSSRVRHDVAPDGAWIVWLGVFPQRCRS